MSIFSLYFLPETYTLVRCFTAWLTNLQDLDGINGICRQLKWILYSVVRWYKKCCWCTGLKKLLIKCLPPSPTVIQHICLWEKGGICGLSETYFVLAPAPLHIIVLKNPVMNDHFVDRSLCL